MDINANTESPFEMKVSFNRLLEQYEQLKNSSSSHIAEHANKVLNMAQKHAILRDGFSDLDLLETYREEIDMLLQDAFSSLLTTNEIKTAQVPFYNHIFKSSQRFKDILSNAGQNFELKVKNMPTDQTYIIASSIILKACYGYDLNFKRPFFYEIPDANGIMRYYKILYNADFTEIKPKENAVKITESDFNQLLDNFENIELWKEKFPVDSYEFKGFLICNIFDVTDDQSISNIKTALIQENKRQDEVFMKDFHDIFRSLLGLKNIKVGFSIYNEDEETFEQVHGNGIESFLLNKRNSASCKDALCMWSYEKLLKENKYFSVSDVESAFKKAKGRAPHISSMHEQGIKSAIFAPIANEDGLMGILEIVSEVPKVLNSINANKLVDVMPFIVSAVERSKNEEENLIKAIIQKECTSIHDSVHWRFEKEAKNYIKDQLNGDEPVFNKIAFKDVYPLYGQMDIKGSSKARNLATKNDLQLQLEAIKALVKKAKKQRDLPIYEQYIFQINKYIDYLDNNFQVDTERQINSFIREEIEPVLNHVLETNTLKQEVDKYLDLIDKTTNSVYQHRKDFDDTISNINKEMAILLDEKQREAQLMYPHYFERYKTDGVEHNMYIGESITKEDSFNPIYLYNLRLWQLQVMIEMENAYYLMKSQFPVSLDVASMILVFNQPLTISFRMDEKQFDVDGTYNARYEIVKKRVDKAFVKGTKERVTQKGKITIVYSQKEDEREYLRYIKFLQERNYLDNDEEIVELEDLQAVTGLKAIRVSVLYHKDQDDKAFFTYEDLMKEINV
ncbi:GAF domain-containing protein [Winogradskyella sp. DF17]|uniref:GAF domain-containing protein n=1 Tax=Winogradskyella pelagia TaxID=2819984 RepID=A0ABS3SYV7_9FLAO|nr:GAF domain-containing protein [Winogradskyella sp. DF17]MBO3115665.1 GAF domain-containing protein [Winogradskyella sp. DF17]